MDCDGAKVEIIKSLAATPPVIIIKTHEALGISSHKLNWTIGQKNTGIIHKKCMIKGINYNISPEDRIKYIPPFLPNVMY